jgi:undecaprenyl-diphosphatase
MNVWDAVILAVVQGLTEFLPVSSSAHLVITKALLNLHTEGVLWEVALHVGTLMAVVALMWRDVWSTVAGFCSGMAGLFGGRPWKQVWEESADFRMSWYIIIGTIPAGLVGVALHEPIERLFQSPIAAAAMLFVTGEILWLTRPHSLLPSQRGIELKDSFWIGVAQAVAVLPGISRSGATISAGLLRDVNRERATRFSFLLSIPVILGAALLEGRKIRSLPTEQIHTILIGMGVAAIVGYLALLVLLKVVRAGRLHCFAYYCWAVSLAAIAWFWVAAAARG